MDSGVFLVFFFFFFSKYNCAWTVLDLFAIRRYNTLDKIPSHVGTLYKP